MHGTLFIISAPSGAGKTSLVKRLVNDVVHLEPSISYTTRQPRLSEKQGRDYHFIDQRQFQTMKESSLFLETAEVFGQFYATAKSDVASMLMQDDVILEIEWQGARQVRAHTEFDIVSIYIVPPSLDDLAIRLRKRSEDSDDVIAKRLKQASEDLSHCQEYDFIVVNDDFEVAADELRSIVLANRCSKLPYSDMINQLLSGKRLEKR